MPKVILKPIDTDDTSVLALVHSLYMDSFPESERRPWNSILELITIKAPFYKFYTAETEDNTFAGFISVWKLPHATYIEHLAILPNLRSTGIGGNILTQVINNAGNEPVVVEVELPDSNEYAQRRISFYERHGFTSLTDKVYFQPPYAPGLPDVQLLLMSTQPLYDYETFVITLHTLVYNQ